MGMWNRIKNYMDAQQTAGDDASYEEDAEKEEEVERRPYQSSPAPSRRRQEEKRQPKSRDRDRERERERIYDMEQYQSPPSRDYRESRSSRVVDIHTTAKLQVVLTKPEKFSDAKEIADNLGAKRTIVLNLESTSKDEALRLLDFLSGVAYANDGEIKKIAQSTFIITPYNVDVMGDLLYELESNGVFFV